nr:hypothetical protein [uncultured Draconibacterium sp.]
MTKKEKNNKLGSSSVSNIIALIALVLAIGSFLYTYIESKRNDMEVLNINSKKTFFPEPAIILTPFNLLPSYWECVLTNNSRQTISINNYDIKCLKDNETIISYSNMNLGLFDFDRTPISLPININAGESIKLYLEIGVQIHPEPMNIINSNVDSTKQYTYNELKNILAKKGTDIFGNKVNAKFENGELLMFSLENNNYNKDKYILTFESGRNNFYHSELNWYPVIYK